MSEEAPGMDEEKPSEEKKGSFNYAEGGLNPKSGMVSRRRTLQLGLGALAAGVAGEFCWVALKGMQPVEQGTPQPVEVQVGDLPVGGSKQVIYGSQPAIVIRREDGFVVFSLVCTHLGCIVKWDGAAETFSCPCHAGYFDKNGRVKSGPPPAALEKLAFKQSGDKVVVGG